MRDIKLMASFYAFVAAAGIAATDNNLEQFTKQLTTAPFDPFKGQSVGKPKKSTKCARYFKKKKDRNRKRNKAARRMRAQQA